MNYTLSDDTTRNRASWQQLSHYLYRPRLARREHLDLSDITFLAALHRRLRLPFVSSSPVLSLRDHPSLTTVVNLKVTSDPGCNVLDAGYGQ